MRVIAGSAKRRVLQTLKGNSVRPTSDKVKEGIFNAIQFEIENKSFLDLFSGTGQIGIEALSRGAKNVVFVDIEKESIEIIKKNLNLVRFSDGFEVCNMDYLCFLKTNKSFFDIVFLDPPYRTGKLRKALFGVTNFMNKDGLIICEHPIDEVLPENVNTFVLSKCFNYGKIMISMYRENGMAI